MDIVMLGREDQRCLSQQAHKPRRRIGVRPLVKLIRREDRKAKGESFRQNKRRDQRGCRGQHKERHAKDWSRQNTTRSVRLDEIVMSDRLGIGVVFAKRPDKVCAEQRRLFGAVAIRKPVHNAGDKVGQNVCGWYGHGEYDPGGRTIQH